MLDKCDSPKMRAVQIALWQRGWSVSLYKAQKVSAPIPRNIVSSKMPAVRAMKVSQRMEEMSCFSSAVIFPGTSNKWTMYRSTKMSRNISEKAGVWKKGCASVKRWFPL